MNAGCFTHFILLDLVTLCTLKDTNYKAPRCAVFSNALLPLPWQEAGRLIYELISYWQLIMLFCKDVLTEELHNVFNEAGSFQGFPSGSLLNR
jgi:hypothetical protein